MQTELNTVVTALHEFYARETFLLAGTSWSSARLRTAAR